MDTHLPQFLTPRNLKDTEVSGKAKVGENTEQYIRACSVCETNNGAPKTCSSISTALATYHPGFHHLPPRLSNCMITILTIIGLFSPKVCHFIPLTKLSTPMKSYILWSLQVLWSPRRKCLWQEVSLYFLYMACFLHTFEHLLNIRLSSPI